MSETTFTFQVDETLKEQFIAAAGERNRSGEELLRALMRDFVDREYDEWFRRQVQAGVDDANAGDLVPDEAVEAEFAARREATRRKLAGSGP